MDTFILFVSVNVSTVVFMECTHLFCRFLLIVELSLFVLVELNLVERWGGRVLDLHIHTTGPSRVRRWPGWGHAVVRRCRR